VRSIILPMMVAALTISGAATAQTIPKNSPDSMLEQARTCYNNAEYENAISQLEKTLQFLGLLKRSDQIEAYKYLAFSYVAFGDTDKAKEQFKKLLALNPRLELDPVTVSPKIIKVFDETKSEMPVSFTAQPAHEPIVKDRGEIVAHSVVLPGWGQMYRGDKSKGKKIMIAAGVSLVAAIITGIISNTRHNGYLNAVDEAAIDNAYKSYKVWYNASSACFVSFLGVYLYNVGDAIFAKSRSPASMTGPGRSYLGEIGSGGIGMCCTFDF
jgi:tetratricopeptide (TPR) repeat protein